MHTTRIMLIAGALTTWILAAACGGTDPNVKSAADVPSASATEVPSAPTSAVPTAPAAASSQAAPPATGSTASTASPPVSDEMAAPLVLQVQGPDPVPSSGDIKIAVDIVTRQPLLAPVTLKAAVPAGATLASGKAEEVLELKQPGTTHRDFVVNTKTTLNAPVVFTAEMKDPQGRMGLRAERKYPSVTVPPATTTPGLKPPVGKPGAPPPGGRPGPAPKN